MCQTSPVICRNKATLDSKSPIIYQKSSIFYQKCPMLYQISPVFGILNVCHGYECTWALQKSPALYQTSRILYQLSSTFRIALKRAQYFIKSAQYSIKWALYFESLSLLRVHVRAFHGYKCTWALQKSPALYQTSWILYQMNPTFRIPASIHLKILHLSLLRVLCMEPRLVSAKFGRFCRFPKKEFF